MDICPGKLLGPKCIINILHGSRLNISIQWISVLVNYWEPKCIINIFIVMYFYQFNAIVVDTLFNYVFKYIETSA